MPAACMPHVLFMVISGRIPGKRRGRVGGMATTTEAAAAPCACRPSRRKFRHGGAAGVRHRTVMYRPAASRVDTVPVDTVPSGIYPSCVRQGNLTHHQPGVTTMNVTIYTRCSTDDQAASGLGLSAQLAACEKFATEAGHTITGVFTDAGVSGAAGIEDRPGLMAAVAGLRRGDVLLIAKRCRLGRDAFAVAMIEKAVSRKGAVILGADGVGNGTDPASQFMKSVIDAAAAYERGLIRSRTAAALAAKRRDGRLTGEVPFGWTVDSEGNLIEVADEQQVLGLSLIHI